MNEEEQGRILSRVWQAEKRIGQLESDLQKANKRATSGVAIFVFVLLMLVIYHYGWVRPIAEAHNSLYR